MTERSLRRPRPSLRGLAFAGVIGWSAFLLFSVEPLVGRLVLPVFGGTPAVWATTLFFFQAVLLLGYLYGHLSVTRLGVRRGAILHIGLLLVAGGALVLAPARVADLRNPALPDVVNLVGMLALTIGLPAFVLTTTTPLVSGWFAASRRADDGGGDAYWLYALSNAGSLLALLSYPFLIEPRLGLSAQRGVWAVAFAAFAIAVAGCAIATVRQPAAPVTSVADAGPGPAQSVRVWRQRGTWLLLAAVPSGLLSAVTTFIATDLVSAPLLWLVPLAIYLITFIIAFSDRGRRLVPAAVGLLPAAVTLMWVPTGVTGGWPILPLVLIAYGGLAIVAAALHGRLAIARPEPARLTEFYLVISIGGALASAFVALLAPIIFPGIWELPILLVLAIVALAIADAQPRATPAMPAMPARPRRRLDFSPFVRGARGRAGPYVVVAVLLAVMLVRDQSIVAEAGIRWLVLGGLLLLVGGRLGVLAMSTALVLALAVLIPQPATIFRDRSFFGVTEVSRSPVSPYTILTNGTTTHGIQSTDPARIRVPLAYYTEAGPFGDLFALLRGAGREPAVAAIGLGAGAVAAYVEPGWSMTFFEIDPIVAAVAAEPSLFSYLSSAAERPTVVLGDARLSLRAVASGSYDAVIVDAFSSDAIPTHLLTTEAMTEYVRVVKLGGPILVHITNRYYDLAPAVAAAGRAVGLDAVQRVYLPTDGEAQKGASIVAAIILIPPNSTNAAADLAAAGWRPVDAVVAPLTDDFMDVLRFLKPLW